MQQAHKAPTLPSCPRASWPPGSPRQIPDVAEPLDGPSFQAVAESAQQHSMYVVAGFYAKVDGENCESLRADRPLRPAGRHLLRSAHPTEGEIENGVVPGGPVRVFDTDFGRVGLAICFDLNWQDLWAKLAEKGAELVCWISAYEGGLPLQAYAWMHQYAIVTSVWPYHARVIERTGKIMTQTSRWGRLAFHNLNFEKRLFHTDGQHQQIVPMQTRYGEPHPHRELHRGASLHTRERRPETLPVDEVIREFRLVGIQALPRRAAKRCRWRIGQKRSSPRSDVLAEPLFELTDIAKSFPGVRALDGVSFDLRAGEVHALLGENGAGKSTLVKIICGIYRPDAGTIRLDGKPIEVTGPTEAQALGISPVHQELHLEPFLSVAENIFLGRQPVGRFGLIDFRRMNRDAGALVKRLGADLDPQSTVESLSVAQRQIIGIARATSTTARIIIFDEPTSSLTERETNLLFDMIARLRAEGLGIIYISHRMEEIFRLCDRVTVLRDGRYVATKPVAETNMRDLIGMMIGRDISDLFRKEPAPIGGVVLEVTDLRKRGLLRGISFSIRRGEIVGVAGLVGAGRTELARAIFGDLAIDGGEIRVDGKVVPPRHTPRSAILAGIGLVPEDRKEQGLVTGLSVRQNISMPMLKALSRLSVLSRRQEHLLAEILREEACDQDAERRAEGDLPERWQPAAGCDRQMAGHTAKAPDRRRTDTRCGHRGKVRNPCAALRSRARGHGHHDDLLRPARSARYERPRTRHAKGPDHRRHSRARSDAGGDHALRDGAGSLARIGRDHGKPSLSERDSLCKELGPIGVLINKRGAGHTQRRWIESWRAPFDVERDYGKKCTAPVKDRQAVGRRRRADWRARSGGNPAMRRS